MQTWRIVTGDCTEVMAAMAEASVDAVVCDPPYGLGFMGHAWDDLPPGREWADACLRVVKPGGHLLAFGGTRTFHRLACAIEDAGFDIRDTIAWLYGSGLPKHASVLKPAHEPIVVARKPGEGALNTHACQLDSARWPANVALDRKAAAMLDTQTGNLPTQATRTTPGRNGAGGMFGLTAGGERTYPGAGETGGASRFFYVAKASTAERNAGLGVDAGLWASSDIPERNDHPTVKPIDLMRWLVRLAAPPGGVVLDPFAGSGTTGCAAVLEGCDFIGVEREAAYAAIAHARLVHWSVGGQ